jgi:hypothetical protein
MTQPLPVRSLGEDGPVIADTRQLRWHTLGDGIAFQLLRFSRVTGEWALYVRMQPGSKIATHKHLSAGEYFVTRGELIYDVGRASAGTYGYEALGEVHAEAHVDVETEYLFLGRGPVAFTAPGGRVEFILDWEFVKRIADGERVISVTESAA